MQNWPKNIHGIYTAKAQWSKELVFNPVLILALPTNYVLPNS
jgi:hypothetical protein